MKIKSNTTNKDKVYFGLW